MSDEPGRESTPKAWVHRLPEHHLARRQYDRLAAIERQVRELADLWDQQQSEYPDTQEGEVAAAAVRCCARELRAILDPPGQSRDMGDDNADVYRAMLAAAPEPGPEKNDEKQ